MPYLFCETPFPTVPDLPEEREIMCVICEEEILEGQEYIDQDYYLHAACEPSES